jgi:hypothetical protein
MFELTAALWTARGALWMFNASNCSSIDPRSLKRRIILQWPLCANCIIPL